MLKLNFISRPALVVLGIGVAFGIFASVGIFASSSAFAAGAPVNSSKDIPNTQAVRWILSQSSNVAADIKKLLVTRPSAMAAVIAVVKEGALSDETIKAITAGVNLARVQLIASGQSVSAGEIYALQVSEPALAAGALSSGVKPAFQAQSALTANDGENQDGQPTDAPSDQTGAISPVSPLVVTSPDMASVPDPSQLPTVPGPPSGPNGNGSTSSNGWVPSVGTNTSSNGFTTSVGTNTSSNGYSVTGPSPYAPSTTTTSETAGTTTMSSPPQQSNITSIFDTSASLNTTSSMTPSSQTGFDMTSALDVTSYLVGSPSPSVSPSQ